MSGGTVPPRKGSDMTDQLTIIEANGKTYWARPAGSGTTDSVIYGTWRDGKQFGQCYAATPRSHGKTARAVYAAYAASR
ncbi:RDF protein [Mycobacterium phage Alex]|uniref:Uncharacterized protein n=3 Tax=Pegunavirus Pg1 TaxID=1986538 RepID=L7TG81_9CAUD|nr:hypothetical protein Serpentine_00104 [Mycobacterium phage Serpentine]AGC33961.1 hypothetical protein PIGLET_00101 [Mycobacterium phage Piglet]AGC34263.1 RDF protein [Mycobacterium phage Alex]